MPTSTRAPLVRYSIAVLVVVVTLLLRWSLWPVLGPELPFLLLWPAVMFAAWHCGFGPGLLATILAAFAADSLLLRPNHPWIAADAAGLALFVTLGATISFITSRLQQARRQIEERSRQLAEADRHKDEFMAMLGHELRSPLSSILSGAAVLDHLAGKSDDLRKLAGVFARQGRQMTRLVNDILDVSRVARGKLRLQREPVELAAVLERAVESSRPLLEARRHELNESLPRAPMWLDADPARLAQIVSNLLNNAAKYTPERGQVWLSAEREGREVVIRIRDNGIGIEPAMLPHIFEAFSQSDRALAHAQGGLGLGLTLVKRLVEMHGGRVEARSDGPGKGSEFTIHLPALEGAPAIVENGVAVAALPRPVSPLHAAEKDRA
jgi:two-component system CheB/CheR fusion protein